MKTNPEYGVRKAQVVLPTRDLLVVPHRGVSLAVSHPAFGPNLYSNNVNEMRKTCTHSKELSQISFREPTTSESVSAAAYDFDKMAKPQILDTRWLQAGRIIRTNKGVIVNPILDSQGKAVLNSGDLEAIKTNSRKIQVGKGHIYLGTNDFGFAEYGTFQTGLQECDAFAQGGLARVIEHTKGVAPNLRAIASPVNYPNGVNVWGFESPKEPIQGVLGLSLARSLGSGRLGVTGGGWVGGYGGGVDVGYAFGVLK